MTSWTLRIAAVMIVLAGAAGRAEAQPTARVHRATDPATGTHVTVSQGLAGSLFMEIAAPGVTVS